MPTFEETTRFRRDHDDLTPEQRQRFKRAVTEFVEDLKRDGKPRASLRVRQLTDVPGKIYEFTWDRDGRATFTYGPERRRGEAHVIWRRIGVHNIFSDP